MVHSRDAHLLGCLGGKRQDMPQQDKSHESLPVDGNAPLDALKSPFVSSREAQEFRALAREGYLTFSGKDPLNLRFMRSAIDPLHGLELDPTDPLQRVIVELIDTPAVQRLKYISQLSVASWVYPDGIHSRFGHVVGSAHLAADILRHIHSRASSGVRREIEEWGPVSVAFAMQHDDGHIAPGSHLAHKVWFDGKPDCHEEMSHRLLKQDEGLRTALENALGVEGAKKLDLVVVEDVQVPRWTWQLVTAGGWNADRGDWVRRDSHMCGVTYGAYETPIIKKNLAISAEGDLVIREAGVPALEAFFGARADMYRSIYHHPTCRVGEKMYALLGRRARDLFNKGELNFADETMRSVLSAHSGMDLSVATMMNMVESWWQYHLIQWERSGDKILRELSGRVLRREPFKRFRHTPEVEGELRERAETLGFDPEYFVVPIPPSEVNLYKDLTAAIKVQRSDGSVVSLTEYSSLMNALSVLRSLKGQGFLAAPQDLLFNFKAH